MPFLNTAIKPGFWLIALALVIPVGEMRVMQVFDGFGITRIFSLCAILCFALSVIFRKQRIRITFDGVILLIFVLAALQSFYRSQYTEESPINIAANLIAYWLIYLVVLNLKSKDYYIPRIMFAFLVGAFFQSLVLIFGAYSAVSFDQYNFRPSGSFINPNTVGYLLMVAVFFGLILYSSRFRNIRFLTVSMMVICTLALFLSLSRAAWLGLFVGLCVFFVYLDGWSRVKMLASLGSIFVIILLLTPVPQVALDRIGTFADSPSEDLSIRERTNQLNLSLNLIRSNPIIGIGFKNFFLYKEDEQLQESASGIHTVLLGIAVEMGLITLSFFMMFLIVLFRKIKRLIKYSENKTTKTMSVWMLALFMSQIVFGMTHFTLINLTFWVSMALISSICDEDRTSSLFKLKD